MSNLLLLNGRRKTTRRRKPGRPRKNAKTKIKYKRTRRGVKVKIKTKNPARRTAARRTGGVTMTKRRKTTRRRRRNPSRARRAGRAVARRTVGAIKGINIRSAFRNVPWMTVGMFAAKWAAKKWGEAATETDPNSWNWASYVKGAVGAGVAGIILNMVRPGLGQRVFEGGLSLMAYKVVQNELIPNSTWAQEQFGADATPRRVPGTVETNAEGEPFILGEDYQWYPLSGADDYRFIPDNSVAGALVPPGPLGFGDALVKPGPLGLGAANDQYAAAFLRR